jgi:hypothetical protein
MNSKMNTTVLLTIAASIVAIGLIVIPSIVTAQNVPLGLPLAAPLAFKKCDPHGCKGDKGYYTEEGHHHCYKGSPECYSNKDKNGT